MATATTTATGIDSTAPTKPGRLRIEATTTSSLTISWRRSTDRTGVVGYTVYRDGTRLGASPASTLRYTAPDLACGRSYEIGVEAYDLAGNRSARATILAPTSACTDTVAPSAPPSVSQVGSDRDEHHGCMGHVHGQRRRRRLRRPRSREPLQARQPRRSTRSRPSSAGRCTRSAFAPSTRAATGRRPPTSCSRRRAVRTRRPRLLPPDSPSLARTSPPSRSGGSRPPTRTASPATASTATERTPGRPRAPRTRLPGLPAARAT